MPAYEETTNRGGYVPFQLKRDYHLDTFGNAVAGISQQHEKAIQQQSQIRLALNQLNLNEAEDEFKQNYINDVMNQIDNAARFGNYSNALDTAIRIAGDAATDPRLTARVRANTEYEKEKERQLDRLAKGDISQNTYNWWLKNNPYKFRETTDDNGNVVGGTLEMTTNAPVNDINWANQAMIAFKLLSPKKSGRAGETKNTVSNATGNTLSRGDTTYSPGEAVGTSSSWSNQNEHVTYEDIKNNLEELLSATPDGYRQAEQAFDVALDEYLQMERDYQAALSENPDSITTTNLGQKLDARKKLMYKNGSVIDYKEYYARMLSNNMYAKGMAYDWTTTSSSRGNSYGLSTLSDTDGRQHGQGSGNNTNVNGGNGTDSWNGPNVKQQVGTSVAEQQVNQASKNTTELFTRK